MQEQLDPIHGWGAAHASAAIVGPGGVLASSGDLDRPYAWASVTKLVTAVAVLREVEVGTISLDESAGPAGSTVRHMLAHASGLGFDGVASISPPERTRIYSNSGFDLLGDLLAERAGASPAEVVGDAVLEPLGLAATRLDGPASHGMIGSAGDLARFAAELLRPALLAPATLAEATSVAFPGLPGVLPGIGRFDPLDWGLGFELRDGKRPHWTGLTNSPRTFGHFGGAGTFLWVDPDAGIALACLTDRPFGSWALDAWPALSDAVLAATRNST